MRKRLLSFFVLLYIPAAALAEATLPPPSERLHWAKQCSGAMPALLIISIAAICILAAIAVLYYRKAGERDGE